MGGKLKLLRVKHLKYPRGHMQPIIVNMHVTPWIFMSESLSAFVSGALVLNHLILGGTW